MYDKLLQVNGCSRKHGKWKPCLLLVYIIHSVVFTLCMSTIHCKICHHKNELFPSVQSTSSYCTKSCFFLWYYLTPNQHFLICVTLQSNWIHQLILKWFAHYINVQTKAWHGKANMWSTELLSNSNTHSIFSSHHPLISHVWVKL